MTNSSDHEYSGDRVTIGDIFRVAWNGKFTVLLVTLICVALSTYVSLTSPRVYRVSFVVMPADTTSDALRTSSNPLSLLTGRGSEPPDFQMYLNLLSSEQVSQWVWQNRPDLHDALFQDKSIGAHVPRGVDANQLAYFSLAQALERSLSITETEYKSQYAVSLQSGEPDKLLKLLWAIHRRANDVVRGVRFQRANAEREHLNALLQTTTVADYRQTLLDLLSRVETQLMTSSVAGDYAGTIVDGPTINPVPVFPRPSLFFRIAIIAGIILGLLVVVFTPLTDASFLRLFTKLRTARIWKTLQDRALQRH